MGTGFITINLSILLYFLVIFMNLKPCTFIEPLFMRELLVFSCKKTIGTYSIVDVIKSFDSSEDKKIIVVRNLVQPDKLRYMSIDKFNSDMEIQYTEYPDIDTSLPIEQYLEIFKNRQMNEVLNKINSYNTQSD